MITTDLDHYLEMLLVAINNQNLDSLSKECGTDTCSIIFYGKQGNRADKKDILFNQTISDLEESVNSDEFIKDNYFFRSKDEMDEEQIITPPDWAKYVKPFSQGWSKYKIMNYNHDNRIVLLQVIKNYILLDKKIDDHAFIVNFFPYQAEDALPKLNIDGIDRETRERKKAEWKAEMAKIFPPGTAKLGMAQAIYNFGQYILKRKYKVKIHLKNQVIKHYM